MEPYKEGCKHINLAANVCGYMPINLGKIIKEGVLADILKAWAVTKTESGDIEVVLDKCSKSYIRFKTKVMSDILPDAEEENSGWNTKNHYFYEIRNNEGTGFLMSLTLSSRNLTDEERNICDKINEHFPSRQQKANWQWRTPFVTKLGIQSKIALLC